MYESPIDIIYNDIQHKVEEEFEKNVFGAVQSYGINVNKEELLKALQYDRQQYDKGYADGYADAKYAYTKAEQRLIPCSERLPEYGVQVLTTDKDGDFELNHIIDEDDGEWYWDGAIAWMPLPEPYREGEA